MQSTASTDTRVGASWATWIPGWSIRHAQMRCHSPSEKRAGHCVKGPADFRSAGAKRDVIQNIDSTQSLVLSHFPTRRLFPAGAKLL
jgi:hypothetical protein